MAANIYSEIIDLPYSRDIRLMTIDVIMVIVGLFFDNCN